MLWGNTTVVHHFDRVRGIPHIIGKTIWELAANAENAAQFTELFARARVEGTVQAGYRSPLDADHWRLSVHPVLEQGNCVALMVWASNHQELVATRERLALSEGMYKSLFDAMASGVVFQAADGRIVAVNRAAELIHGRSAAQMMGLTSDDSDWGAVRDDGSPFPGPEHPAMVTLRSGEPQNDVVMGILRPDGERRWLSICTQPVRTGDAAQASAVVATFHDITEARAVRESLKQKVEELDKAWEDTLAAMSDMVEKRDPYTAGHQQRVADIAVAIARQLGWDDARCQVLRNAGVVHDIGKIAIPTELLAKPARLTPIEFDIVKQHVDYGYSILSNIPSARMIATIARQHHERLDGSGYPQGLKGEEILPEARVLAVADVAESMSSDRPYRPGLGIMAALAELERGAGTIYDAEVVAAFKATLTQAAPPLSAASPQSARHA